MILSNLLLFTLLGLGEGVVYAALSLSLVVTYKATRVVNFAQGAVAMWAAYTFYELQAAGKLFFPAFIIPAYIQLPGPPPVILSLFIAVIAAVLISVASHYLVFRPLSGAPPLARIVASVGIMLTLESIASIQFGSEQRVVPNIIPGGAISIASQNVPIQYLALVAAAILVTFGTYYVFTKTKTGIAIQALAENKINISLLGWAPQYLELTAAALSGVITGLFGVLVSPITGINTINYTLYVIPALAIALLANMNSIWISGLGGLALGVLQSLLQYAQTSTWYPNWAQVSLTEVLPFLIIIVILSVRGHILPTRDEALTQVKLPWVWIPKKAYVALLVILVAGSATISLISGIYRFGIIESILAALIMLSFTLLIGLAGQISLAQVTLAGLSGFLLFKVSSIFGIGFPLAPLIAAIGAMAAGILAAIPALRVRGTQLAVLSLAFAIAVEQFVFNNSYFVPAVSTTVAGPSIDGLNLAIRKASDIARLQFGFLSLAALLLGAYVFLSIAKGTTGKRLLAVRSSEKTAASIGINVVSAKLVAFAIGSFLAGLAGGLITYSLGRFSPPFFDAVSVGIPFLAFAYLGGVTSITGAIIAGLLAPAGIIFVILNRFVNNLGPYYLLASGLGLIVASIFYPEGMVGTFRAMGTLIALKLRLHRKQSNAETGQVQSHTTFPSSLNAVKSAGSPQKVILKTNNLNVSYGKFTAVQNVSFTLKQGEFVALIGPNGAGKTSILDAVTGFTKCSGEIIFNSLDITNLPPHKIARLGLVRTWQVPEVFSSLTVKQEVSTAESNNELTPFIADLTHLQVFQRKQRLINEILDWLDLARLAELPTHNLTLGQRKLLGLARALATEPKMLLLDEPAAGLDSFEGEKLGEMLKQLSASGITILLIEHDMELVFSICSRIMVMHQGQIIADGDPSYILKHNAVKHAYLGHFHTDLDHGNSYTFSATQT